MAPSTSGGTLRFTPTADDPERADVTVVLDTTWTPASPPPAAAADATATPIVGLRDVAELILAAHDLIVETSTRLDRWAAASGVIERLTIRDTSFWFYVRLRHWAWLQERILWAGIADLLVRDHRPVRIVCAVGTDAALVEVLRLVTARDGIALVEERPPEPSPEPIGAGPPRAAASVAPARSSGVARPPSPAVSPRRSRLRRSILGRLARRIRDGVFGPPPPPPHVVRQLEIKRRIALVRSHIDALAAEPEGRLLVVHEHARQRVETPAGPRTMNPYLDPIVDRLRGTALEPVILDFRAHLDQDAAWERIGSGLDPRILPIDALAMAAALHPAAAAADPERRIAAERRSGRARDEAPDRRIPAAGPPAAPATDAGPAIDPVLAAWRDALAIPIEAFGVDLAPLLAANVVVTASRFLPGMAASIDRIERFVERIRPAAIVLADEYHRQDWMVAARSVGVPVAAVQHGMIYPHHNGYIHAARPDGMRLPARTYVFGRWERDLLRTASVYRDDEVLVGGSPRLDLVDLVPGDRAGLRRELGVADDAHLVVVSGTWGPIFRRFHYPIALARLVDRALPEVHFVVKLHPGEPDEGPYRRIIEQAAAARNVEPPNVTIVQAIDLYRLLAAADAHLGIHSTVLTEAVVTRTRNLLATGVAGADLLGYIPAGVATPVRDGGDLLAALAATGDEARREADAVAFATAHFEPGSASERIAASLLAWLA